MKSALGRGIESLLPEKGEEVIKLDIDRILPGENQPRKVFRDESLNELAESIKEKGVIQPIIVKRTGDGTFRLIAGERRWRAAKIAGLKKIPAIIKDYASKDALEIALIENIQREDLDPIETALAFERLQKEYNLTQEEIAKKVGKDRATVANYMRLLNLPDEIKRYIHEGKITFGHARAILSIPDLNAQIECAMEIIKKNLSVRTSEEIARRFFEKSKKKVKHHSVKDPNIKDMERKLKRALGTEVRIIEKGKKGKIEIIFNSHEEFQRLFDLLVQ